MFLERASSSIRRALRMISGLILFTYIGAHMTNHALGLISLGVAEAGMEISVGVWYSLPGTILLYGAAASHFLMALWGATPSLVDPDGPAAREIAAIADEVDHICASMLQVKQAANA